MFFKMVQNKIHFAVHGRTAAELIVDRADAEKEHMGLTTWENAPDGKEDWAKRIDAYLSSDERPLLDNVGSVSHEEAVLHAETEFEKYRIIQDRLFQSDFDKYLGELPFIDEPEE